MLFPEISLFIPVYNPGNNFEANLRRCYDVLQESGLAFELIVVDDTSVNFGEIKNYLAAMPANTRVKYVRYKSGPSRRENLSRAFSVAQAPTIGFIDYDLSCDVTYFLEAAALLKKAQADMVVGSRYTRGARAKRKPLRRLLSFFYNLAIRLYFGSRINDHQCGLKVFRKDTVLPVIAQMGYDESHVRGWFWDAELLIRAQAKGLKIIEMPVTWRYADTSTFDFKRELRCLRAIVGLKSAVPWAYPASGPDWEYYYRLGGEYFWLASHYAAAIYFAGDLLTKHKGSLNILDAGCGAGALCRRLCRFGETVGVDSSQESLDACRQETGFKVVKGSLLDLPFADNSFDLVFSLDTIEHIADDVAALGELRRVLKPGGYLIALVPAFMALWGSHDENYGHFRRYDKTGFAAAAAGAGFSIVRLRYFKFLPFLPLWCMRKLKGLTHDKSTDLFVLPGPLNRLARSILEAELPLAKALALPCGASLAGVLRKPLIDAIE